VRMALTQQVPVQATGDSDLNTTLVDILRVLEERQDMVSERWDALLRQVEATDSQEFHQQAILVDQELSRYWRFLTLLRKQSQGWQLHSPIFTA